MPKITFLGAGSEVPCLVDRNGIQPTRIGALPPHLAALMQTNINVQALTVEATLTGRREHIYPAALLDPHTAAELDRAAVVFIPHAPRYGSGRSPLRLFTPLRVRPAPAAPG